MQTQPTEKPKRRGTPRPGNGGAREGAGRPSTGRKRLVLYLTDTERKLIEKKLSELRGK
jgi:hypothetical protein